MGLCSMKRSKISSLSQSRFSASFSLARFSPISPSIPVRCVTKAKFSCNACSVMIGTFFTASIYFSSSNPNAFAWTRK